jgi:hypothetical protein
MKIQLNEVEKLQKMAGVINKNKQIDISDEEIRDAAIQYEDTINKEESPMAHFIEGAMWYRERLNKI